MYCCICILNCVCCLCVHTSSLSLHTKSSSRRASLRSPSVTSLWPLRPKVKSSTGLLLAWFRLAEWGHEEKVKTSSSYSSSQRESSVSVSQRSASSVVSTRSGGEAAHGGLKADPDVSALEAHSAEIWQEDLQVTSPFVAILNVLYFVCVSILFWNSVWLYLADIQVLGLCII